MSDSPSEDKEKTVPKPPRELREQNLQRPGQSQPPTTDRSTRPGPGLGDILGSGIRSISDMVEQLGDNIGQLQADVEQKLRVDTSKDETINALHKELQVYRQDLVVKILQPLIFDLMELHDDIGQMMDAYDPDQEPAVATVLADMEDIQNDLLKMIERYGFDAYFSGENTYNKTTQKVQRVIPTDNPALDYQIARRVRKGLRYGERIIRPEMVEIYRHKADLGRGN